VKDSGSVRPTRSIPRLAVGDRQALDCFVSVETAGIGEDPQLHSPELIALATLDGFRSRERLPIRSETKDGNDPRLPAPHVRLQCRATSAKLVDGQFLGASAGRRDDVGDADTEPEHQPAISLTHSITDVDEMRRDPRSVQRRPESIAATGEVSIDGRGPQSWIDPDEEQSHAIVDEVVDRCAVERFQFGSSELHGLSRRPRRLVELLGGHRQEFVERIVVHLELMMR